MDTCGCSGCTTPQTHTSGRGERPLRPTSHHQVTSENTASQNLASRLSGQGDWTGRTRSTAKGPHTSRELQRVTRTGAHDGWYAAGPGEHISAVPHAMGSFTLVAVARKVCRRGSGASSGARAARWGAPPSVAPPPAYSVALLPGVAGNGNEPPPPGVRTGDANTPPDSVVVRVAVPPPGTVSCCRNRKSQQ